jgi:uncharacterized membrane protein
MKKTSLFLLSALFASAGMLHLLRPKTFLQIVPPYLPFPAAVVPISGLAELAGAAGILIRRTRPAARWGLVVLLVAVFPANLYMAQAHVQPGGMQIPAWALWLRLPFQPLLLWWVLAATREANL